MARHRRPCGLAAMARSVVIWNGATHGGKMAPRGLKRERAADDARRTAIIERLRGTPTLDIARCLDRNETIKGYLSHHDRWRLPFEFADRQSAFHRAGIVGCRRRLGRPQLGWARSQSVDDLARASRRHRLDVPLRLPPILGSAPRRSRPSSQCPKLAPRSLLA
jgi:hypothetical protein